VRCYEFSPGTFMPADDAAIALRCGACSLRQRAPLNVHDVEHVA
jgi:hypothetical protein